jgi:hypothetical protein
MPNALYNQLNGGGSRINPMLQRLKQFKSTFSGDPQQMIQNMISSGKITQNQVNGYVEQANEIYKQLKDFM